MPSDPLPDTDPTAEGLDPVSTGDAAPETEVSDSAELPSERSEFSQRLASFGLGEAPDPLLTDARPPKRRSQH